MVKECVIIDRRLWADILDYLTWQIYDDNAVKLLDRIKGE